LLIELGAHSVQVWDPDPARARAQTESTTLPVSVAEYRDDDTPIGGLDLAIVPDLGMFNDGPSLMGRVRETIAGHGVALVGAASESAAGPGSRGFDYYELFDLIAREFSFVHMVAELPFRGVAFVALGEQDGEPPVSVDTQLAQEGRATKRYVIIASEREVAFDPYAIVELPEGATEVALQAAGAQSAKLEAELRRRAHQVADLAAELEEARAAAEAGRVTAAEVDEMAGRVEAAERHARTLERDLKQAGEGQATEVQELETSLRDKAQAARALEAELERRDRLVRELVTRLETSTEATGSTAASAGSTPREAPAEDSSRLREQLDALALDLARRQGDAQASAWKIAELERRLAERAPASAAQQQEAQQQDAASGRLAAALDEIEALRRALSQEHDARVRAESGEELARARAEIERQAVLLEQVEQQRDKWHASPAGKG
jgi:hypothetical protein